MENLSPQNSITENPMENLNSLNSITENPMENLSPQNSITENPMENLNSLNSITENPMENLRPQNSISGDQIPKIENKELEFEFGSITEPTSPKSPADHLFSNGRLLPHYFPVKTASSITRSTSRTSTINSKDSLISSRSSSTISRTSSCGSSARTSISTEASGHKRAFKKNGRPKMVSEKSNTALIQQYAGSSQQWQFIAPAPMMKQGPRGKKREIVVREKKNTTGEVSFCWRILKWFVWVCQKCHSIEPLSEDGLPR